MEDTPVFISKNPTPNMHPSNGVKGRNQQSRGAWTGGIQREVVHEKGCKIRQFLDDLPEQL
jgi:hypothetical protein